MIYHSLIASFVLTVIASSAIEQQSDSHWVSTDSIVSKQAHPAFANELAPDRDDPETHTLPMTFKFIYRVGLRGQFCSRLIGKKKVKHHLTPSIAPSVYDLRTQAKAAVRSKDTEWFWIWRLEKVSTPQSVDTDVLFQFLTCTECEATRLLADFHYSKDTGIWEIRQWSKEDGAALMIGDELNMATMGLLHRLSSHSGQVDWQGT